MAKKKTKVKSIARPIATTSIPSATKKVEPSTEPVSAPDSVPGTPGPSNDSKQPSDQLLPTSQDGQQLSDQPMVEADPLQLLVEAIQPKVEKEIGRILKAYETDFRFSNSDAFHSVQFSVNIMNPVLDQAIQEFPSSRKVNLALSEEKLLSSLGITYGVLLGLGLNPDLVNSCLSEIQGVSLEEAFEWIYLNCPEDQLRETLISRYSEQSNAFQPGLQSLDGHVRLESVQSVKPTAGFSPHAGSTEPESSEGNGPETGSVQEDNEETSSPQDIFSDPDGDEPDGGLLGILDAPIAAGDGNTGKTVSTREMGLTKSQASSPRYLLERHVSKADPSCSVSFRAVSLGFCAYQAECSVHFSGQRAVWTMPENVACPEEVQALNYASLQALHSLVALDTSPFLKTSKSAPGFLAQLSPAFRELWDELELERQTSADSTNKCTWEKLRQVLQTKYAKDGQNLSSKKHNGRTDLQGQANGSSALSHPSLSSDEIHSLIQDRQNRPAYQDMLPQRSALPIAHERANILRHLEQQQILVLCGATGSGKSTQLPTYILENEMAHGRSCNIICTEPRRISAISLAARCSVELGESPDAVGTSRSLVGYSVRLDNKTSSNTRLTFMTNGIAVRMLSDIKSLDAVTHLIIDEVHERSVEVDFLLLALKSILKTRPSLKVVLMSATADAERISQYFGFAGVLYIPGRTFPVEARFLEDAVQETQWVVTESSPYARREYKSNQPSKNRVEMEDADGPEDTVSISHAALANSYSPQTLSSLKLLDDRMIPYELIVRLLEHLCLGVEPRHSSILIFLPGLREIMSLADTLEEHPLFPSDIFRVFPLHSSLSSDAQNSVFEVLPRGLFKIVIATNIAETGITISDITCVIDSCRHKEMRYQRQTNRLLEMFISKANALQRRGRAGRVRPGECYHLCTKERFDKMLDHPIPEILRINLTDVALRIKSLEIDLGANSIADALTQALEPPPLHSVQRAVAMLIEVGALTTTEEMTPMGHRLSQLPTDIHLAKLFLVAAMLKCLDPALTIAAALTTKSPFVAPFNQERQADAAKAQFKKGESDFLTIHNVFASWRIACANGVSRAFCRNNYVNEQTLAQIEELRQQFFGYLLDASFIRVERNVLNDLRRAQATRGKRAPHRTHFFTIPSDLGANSNNEHIVSAALTTGLYPRIMKVEGSTMRTITNNQAVLFHPTSVNSSRRFNDREGTAYYTYFTLTQSQNKRVYAAESGPANYLALILLCGDPEFKLASSSVSLGKTRFKGSPKEIVALKILRSRLDYIFSILLKGSSDLTDSQKVWLDLACRVLGNIQIDDSAQKQSLRIR